MKKKSLLIYFVLYLFITSSSIFLLQNSLYNVYTPKKLTGKRVCLVIVDGLRYDSVKSMSFLSSITSSKNGILYKAYSGLPSNSRPGYERILSGTLTEINGIDKNNKPFPSLTPNLLSITNKSGLKNFVSGLYWLHELYPFTIQRGKYYFLRDGETFNCAKSFLSKVDYDFCLIHPMTADGTGHKYGGSSIEYKKASIKIDKELEDLWKLLRDKNYTMLVVADHGHLDKGGHGDNSLESTTVPIAIIDSNLKELVPENNITDKKLLDVAPTVCDLLGIPKSIYMTGESLVKHDNNIYKIRNTFSSNSNIDFEKYFKLSSIFTNIILSLYTLIYFSSIFIILKLIKNKR